MESYHSLVRLRGILVAFSALALILACGCGGGKSAKGNSLSGKVTFQDAPLTGGSITLHSGDGKYLYKNSIAADGTYTIGGITPGEMIVTIETESIQGRTGVAQQAPGKTASDKGLKMEKYVEIPKSYSSESTTPLHVTVKRGATKMDFHLNEAGQ